MRRLGDKFARRFLRPGQIARLQQQRRQPVPQRMPLGIGAQRAAQKACRGLMLPDSDRRACRPFQGRQIARLTSQRRDIKPLCIRKAARALKTRRLLQHPAQSRGRCRKYSMAGAFNKGKRASVTWIVFPNMI